MPARLCRQRGRPDPLGEKCSPRAELLAPPPDRARYIGPECYVTNPHCRAGQLRTWLRDCITAVRIVYGWSGRDIEGSAEQAVSEPLLRDQLFKLLPSTLSSRTKRTHKKGMKWDSSGRRMGLNDRPEARTSWSRGAAVLNSSIGYALL